MQVRRAVVLLLILGLATGCTSSNSDPNEVGHTYVVESPLSCELSGCVGEGINTADGSWSVAVEDLLFPAGLYGIELVRHYRSDRTSAGVFGDGWSTLYDTEILSDGDDVRIMAPVGLEPRWQPEAPLDWSVSGTVRVVPGGGGAKDLVWPSGERWSFGDDGHLSQLKSPYGQEVTIEWAEGSLMSVTSNQGVTLQFVRQAGALTGVMSSDGRSVVYDFESGSLTEVEGPGLSHLYGYQSTGELIEFTGPAGVTTTEYADGRVSQQTTVGGASLELSYDGLLATATGEHSWTFDHDPEGRLIGMSQDGLETELRNYDSDGRLVLLQRFAHPGRVVTHEQSRTFEGPLLKDETVDGTLRQLAYDDQNRLVSVTDPDGVTSFSYDGSSPLPIRTTAPASGTTEYTYVDGFLGEVTDETGVVTKVGRDAAGNPTSRAVGSQDTWSFEFDAEGNLTKKSAPSGRVWASEWAPRALLLRDTDPLGRTTTNVYDAAGRLIETSGPGGMVTRSIYDNRGRLVREVSSGDLETQYSYDDFGRVTQVLTSDGQIWSTGFEQLGGGGSVATVLAPDGSSTEFEHDSAGREIARRYFEADGGLVEEMTKSYEYGDVVLEVVRRGRSSLETVTRLDSQRRVVEVTRSLDGESLGSTTYQFDRGLLAEVVKGTDVARYSYDSAGRLVQVVSGGEMWAVEFVGGSVARTSHNESTTSIAYDEDGRAVSFADDGGVETTWSFDGGDRPFARTIAGQTEKFEWSATDRLVGYTDLGGATWRWRYDSSGRLTSAAEPGGLTTEYEYLGGRVSRISSTGPQSRDDRFSYDSLGRLEAATTSDGSFNFTYDATGLPRSVSGSRGDETWAYDAAGRLVTVQAAESAYDIDYDARGRLTGVVGADSQLTAEWSTDNLLSVETADGRSIRMDADEAGRLSSVEWNPGQTITLAWSDDSSALQVTGSSDEPTQLFGLEEGRLTSYASGEDEWTMDYSPAGLPTQLSVTGSRGEGSLTFDEFDRPSQVESPGGVATFSYDARSRVVRADIARTGSPVSSTVVSYGSDSRSVDGESGLVDALYSVTGAPLDRSTLSLPEPLSAGSRSVQAVETGLDQPDELLNVEPEPLESVAEAVVGATPRVVGPLGVRDLPRLAEQIAASEIARLSPVLRVGLNDLVRLPVVDLETGRVAVVNPFRSAEPAARALAALDQVEEQPSFLDQVIGVVGAAWSGLVSIGRQFVELVMENPLVRSLTAVGSWGVARVLCRTSVACLSASAVASVFLVSDGALNLVSAVRGTIAACVDAQVARCGLGIIGSVLAALVVAQGAQIGAGVIRAIAATRALASAVAIGSGISLASGRVGVAFSDLRAALRLERVVAREVSVCGGTVCARLDAVTRNLFGRLRFVESKNGPTAVFTQHQRVVYPILQSGDAYFPNGLLNSAPGVFGGRLEVQHWNAGVSRLRLP